MITVLLEEERGAPPASSFKGRELHEEEALLVFISLNIHIHIE